MKVLFCTDGSKISYNSILNLSQWVDDLVVDVLCVVDLSSLPDSIVVEDKEFGIKCENSADCILQYSEKLLSDNNIKIGRMIKMCGSTVDSIFEIASAGDYKLIVLGSHGKKGIQKWLGSVSQEVSSVAKNSTYISKSKNDCKKVLFAVDSLELSPIMVSKCLKHLKLKDKEISLITVYEVPDYLFLDSNIDSKWILEVEKKQEREALMFLNKFERMFSERGLKVTHKMALSGIPAQEIISFANKENIDLVVSGIRDKNKFAKFLLGSVSKRVLENVKSDVLIVRLN